MYNHRKWNSTRRRNILSGIHLCGDGGKRSGVELHLRKPELSWDKPWGVNAV